MPKSPMGTDWTTISSHEDKIVSETSGIADAAQHEVQYKAGIDHNELVKVRSGKHNSRIKHSGKWSKRVSPVEQAYMAVYYSSAL